MFSLLFMIKAIKSCEGDRKQIINFSHLSYDMRFPIALIKKKNNAFTKCSHLSPVKQMYLAGLNDSNPEPATHNTTIDTVYL